MKYLYAISCLVWVFWTQTAIAQPIEEMTFDQKISAYARQYSVNEKKVRAIIQCESGFNQNAKNVNKNGTIDYSIWQINDYYWGEFFLEKGYDITKPEDNLKAGFLLYSLYGDKPWIWSKPCWSKMI